MCEKREVFDFSEFKPIKKGKIKGKRFEGCRDILLFSIPITVEVNKYIDP